MVFCDFQDKDKLLGLSYCMSLLQRCIYIRKYFREILHLFQKCAYKGITCDVMRLGLPVIAGLGTCSKDIYSTHAWYNHRYYCDTLDACLAKCLTTKETCSHVTLVKHLSGQCHKIYMDVSLCFVCISTLTSAQL